MASVRSNARSRVIAAAVAVVLAVVATVRYGYTAWRHRLPLNQPFPYHNSSMADFKDAVWLPSRDVLHGTVDPYIYQQFDHAHPYSAGFSPYTPSHLAIGSLFGELGWPVASAIWSALGALLIASVAALATVRAARLVWPGLDRTGLVLAAAVGVVAMWAWRPSALAILLGQPSALYGPLTAAITLLLAGQFGARQVRGQGRARDGVLGLAATLTLGKPQLGAQTVLALILARRWRALIGSVLVVAVLSVGVATRLAGSIGNLPHWLGQLPGHVLDAPSRYDPRVGNGWIDVSAWLHYHGAPHGLLGPIVAVLLLVGSLVCAVRLSRRARAGGAALALTLGSLLVFPHWLHDDLLLFPLVLVAVAETYVRRHEQSRRELGAWLVAFLAVLVCGTLPNPWLDTSQLAAVASIALFAALAACAVAAVLARPAPALRQQVAQPVAD